MAERPSSWDPATGPSGVTVPALSDGWDKKGVTTWLEQNWVAVADFKANPYSDFTWGSKTNLASAVVSGNKLAMAGDTGETLNFSSSLPDSSPWGYFTVPRTPLTDFALDTGRVLKSGHIQTDEALGATGAGNYQCGCILVQHDGVPTSGKWLRFNVGNYGAPDSALVARVDYEGAAPAGWKVSLTTSSQGCHWRLIAYEDGTVQFEVYDAVHGTLPTDSDWVAIGNPYAMLTGSDTDLRVGPSSLDIGITTGVEWNHRLWKLGYPGIPA